MLFCIITEVLKYYYTLLNSIVSSALYFNKILKNVENIQKNLLKGFIHRQKRL